MSEQKNGLALERTIAELFRSKGYEVTHNVWLRGRSGVKHQIDVLAEYKAPLHKSRIIIECKAHDNPIGKDVVIKLIQEVEDLGVDRGILITTSYFTSDAVSIARGRPISLWDGNKLRTLLGEIPRDKEVTTNIFYAKPRIRTTKAIEVVDKEVRGLWRKRGKVIEKALIFYPYYELTLKARIQENKGIIVKKIEEKIVAITAICDSITGEICKYTPKSGIAKVSWIPKLSEDEKRIFKILIGGRSLTTSAAASLLGCSTAKARKILQGLVAKGVIRSLTYKRQIYYTLKIPVPSAEHVNSTFGTEVARWKPAMGIQLTPALTISDIEASFQLLWDAKVRGYRIVLYPYLACEVAENRKRHVKAVDMLIGVIDERISRILTIVYSELEGLR